MNNILDPDLNEYLSEYKLQVPVHEPISHYEEGELEAQWLSSAGFPQLIKPFQEGREIRSSELEHALAGLSKPHAEAVKQRVRALNRTVRGRTKLKYKRKPDIRDVFLDIDDSSTGTRSRSATPDSLDSTHGDESWNNVNLPNFVSVFEPYNNNTTSSGGEDILNVSSCSNRARQKQKLRRTPSAPLRGSAELFRGTHVRCDIPFYTAEGIELLGFQRIGTIHIPRVRSGSGSDLSCSLGRHRGNIIGTSLSENNLLDNTNDDDEHKYLDTSSKTPSEGSSPSSRVVSGPLNIHQTTTITTTTSTISNASPSSLPKESISFESMCDRSNDKNIEWERSTEHCIDINDISESDLKRLQTFLWLELATLFDKYHVTLDKRKPFKRRRKEEGNLFGVSLNALIRRDQQLTGEDSTLVPLFLQAMLNELMKRGAKEEGILRIAGHKQKTEMLYNELETVFYQKPNKASQLLCSAGVHDLSALLKRWLRELPQPILASELIQLFYQTNAIPPPDQYRALSIVCLLLPAENRNTLRSLLQFLNYIIERQSWNKMSKHNVSTIIAPSFFPPRYVHPADIDKSNIADQVKVAAICCQLTNVLISQGEMLFMVPQRLIDQSRIRQGKRATNRRLIKTLNNNEGNTITREINPSHVHRIVI